MIFDGEENPTVSSIGTSHFFLAGLLSCDHKVDDQSYTNTIQIHMI